MSALSLIWLSLACASISFTLTKTPMFDWIRNILPDEGLLQDLWGCPYCMSHYVAMFLIGVTRPMPFTGTPFDWIICVFVLVTLSTFAVQSILILGRLVTYMRRFENE